MRSTYGSKEREDNIKDRVELIRKKSANETREVEARLNKYFQ